MSNFIKVKLVVLVVICSLIVTFKAAEVHAQEGILEGSPIEVSADVAIYTKYIWRGLTLDDDSVMQSGIYVSAHGFTASIWGSFDFDADDSVNSDEVDYAVDYTHQLFDKLTVSIGHTYYDFPGTDGASKEFYLGAGLDMPLSPTLTWYHDYGEEDSGGGDGDYVVLELSKSLPLGDTLVSLDLSGHVGYNNELFISGDGGDIAFGVGLSFPLTEKITFSPNVNYSIPFGDVEDAYNDEFYGGFSLAFDF